MKAFMGIKETLEYLETYSVLVSVYNSDTVPLFYSRSSKIKAENVIRNTKEIVDVFKINKQIGLEKSLLICNPIDENGTDMRELCKNLLPDYPIIFTRPNKRSVAA